MGFGGNTVFEKHTSDFRAINFQQVQPPFKSNEEYAMKSNISNAYGFRGARPGSTVSNGISMVGNASMQFPTTHLASQPPQQLQQQAWHVTLQAIPSAAALNEYSDARVQQSARAYPSFVQQQQQQLFYPDQLRGHLLKAHRHASAFGGDMMFSDVMALEPKRRTRRRRRRPRKTDMELAAMVHIPDTSCSPTGLDQEDDDPDSDDNSFAPAELHTLHSSSASSSSSASAAALSASSASARSSMEFETPAGHDDLVACKDPWQTNDDDDAFQYVGAACFDELDHAFTSSNSPPLGSCTSQLLYSDDETTMESRLESKLKFALAWHSQLGDTAYFSRPHF
jgi:hypothetical protein